MALKDWQDAYPNLSEKEALELMAAEQKITTRCYQTDYWTGNLYCFREKWASRDDLHITNPEEYFRLKELMIKGSSLTPKKEPWKC